MMMMILVDCITLPHTHAFIPASAAATAAAACGILDTVIGKTATQLTQRGERTVRN